MVDEGSARGGYISTGRDLSIQCFRDEFGLGDPDIGTEPCDEGTRWLGNGTTEPEGIEVYCPII